MAVTQTAIQVPGQGQQSGTVGINPGVETVHLPGDPAPPAQQGGQPGQTWVHGIGWIDAPPPPSTAPPPPNQSTVTFTNPGGQSGGGWVGAGPGGTIGNPAVGPGQLPMGSFWESMQNNMSPEQLATIQGLMQDRGFVRPGMDLSDESVQDVEDAMFARQMRLLGPQFEQQQRQMEQRLANQGIGGGEAYDRDWRNHQFSRDQAMMDAADRSVLAGREELNRMWQRDFQDRQFELQENLGRIGLGQQYEGMLAQITNARDLGMLSADTQFRVAQIQAQAQQMAASMSAGATVESANIRAQLERDMGLLNDAFRRDQLHFNQQQQGWQNDMSARQQFFNEMGFFGGGAGAPQLGLPQMPGLDVTGAYGNYNQGWGPHMQNYNNQYQQYAADVGAQNSQWATAAMAAMYMFSSRTLKEDIREYSTDDAFKALRATEPKRWRYKGQPQEFIGPIAEEAPLDVSPNGLMVNLANQIGILTKVVKELDRKINKPRRKRKRKPQ